MDRERVHSMVKKEVGTFGSFQRLKKQVRPDGPIRVEAFVASKKIVRCVDYGRQHPDECWTKFGACLHVDR